MSELRSGVALQPVDDPASFSAMIREIEELGFDNLWLTDSSLHARNCYAYLTLAAQQSSRLTLGTAVTNPLTRHPAITASAIATVDEISGGRTILGIGAGDRPLLALGLKPSPLADLEAAINGVRALWSGAEVDLEAGSFSLREAHLRFGARTRHPGVRLGERAPNARARRSSRRRSDLAGRPLPGGHHLGARPHRRGRSRRRPRRRSRQPPDSDRTSPCSPTARSTTIATGRSSGHARSQPGSRRPLP